MSLCQNTKYNFQSKIIFIYKINLLITLAIFSIVNSLAFANENSHYDFDEFSFGLSLSSLNSDDIVSYNHSRTLSDSFFYTIDLSQNAINRPSQFTESRAQAGFGWYTGITDITDVHFELAYSRTWAHGLNSFHYDSLHLKSTSTTDLSNNAQLVTETTFNKVLSLKDDYFKNNRRKIDFDVAGKFNLKNNKFLAAGLSSNKGFPYLGLGFK